MSSNQLNKSKFPISLAEAMPTLFLDCDHCFHVDAIEHTAALVSVAWHCCQCTYKFSMMVNLKPEAQSHGQYAEVGVEHHPPKD